MTEWVTPKKRFDKESRKFVKKLVKRIDAQVCHRTPIVIVHKRARAGAGA